MMRYRAATMILLAVTGLLATAGVCAAQSQTEFVAIDMITTDLGAKALGREAPQLIGSSPLILVTDGQGGWFVRAMTVDAATGAQLGQPVEFLASPNPCFPTAPCDILYSEYFAPGRVIVLGDDGTVVDVAITILPDGTPEMVDPHCYPPDPVFPSLGAARAMTELPGSAFQDGKPRLFVGTESGNIAVIIMPLDGGTLLEGVIDLLAGQPITALGPIPQKAGPVLGAAQGSAIAGIKNLSSSLPAVQFTAVNPSALAVADFGATAPPDDNKVYIAFCDGVNIKVPRAELPADPSGSFTMVLFPPDPVIPILMSPPVGLALGSMLMLTADGQGVYYDPGYDVLTGPSMCIADVNDPEPAVCVECPITFTGDVNQNGALTSADIIYLVGFVFKSVGPLQPCEMAGDVNCDGKVTSADIISLVNFVFKGGPPPCNVCSIWLDLWTDCS